MVHFQPKHWWLNTLPCFTINILAGNEPQLCLKKLILYLEWNFSVADWEFSHKTLDVTYVKEHHENAELQIEKKHFFFHIILITFSIIDIYNNCKTKSNDAIFKGKLLRTTALHDFSNLKFFLKLFVKESLPKSGLNAKFYSRHFSAFILFHYIWYSFIL